MLPHLTGPYGLGRMPVADHAWGQISENGATRSNDGAAPDSDSGADENVVWQPYFIFNMDRFLLDGKINSGVVVESGAQVYVMCDCDIGTDEDFPQIVKDTVVANPDIVPYAQLPGIGYADAGTEPDGFANFCSEESQQETAPGVQDLG